MGDPTIHSMGEFPDQGTGRKRPREDYENAIYCQVCESMRVVGSRAQKVCAYCGFHLCLKHYSMMAKTNCEAGEYKHLKTYYSHEWWDAGAYHDPNKSLIKPDPQPIEILGFRDNKLVVMTRGRKRPRGKFSRGVSFKT